MEIWSTGCSCASGRTWQTQKDAQVKPAENTQVRGCAVLWALLCAFYLPALPRLGKKPLLLRKSRDFPSASSQRSCLHCTACFAPAYRLTQKFCACILKAMDTPGSLAPGYQQTPRRAILLPCAWLWLIRGRTLCFIWRDHANMFRATTDGSAQSATGRQRGLGQR